jgi:hypothetical protein
MAERLIIKVVAPSVRLSIRLPTVRLSVLPSICLFDRLSVHLSVLPSICLPVCHQSVLLAFHLSLRLSICIAGHMLFWVVALAIALLGRTI